MRVYCTWENAESTSLTNECLTNKLNNPSNKHLICFSEDCFFAMASSEIPRVITC